MFELAFGGPLQVVSLLFLLGFHDDIDLLLLIGGSVVGDVDCPLSLLLDFLDLLAWGTWWGVLMR